jgi:hypothetical protein
MGPAQKMWPNNSAKFCGLDSSHLFYYFELDDFVHIMKLQNHFLFFHHGGVALLQSLPFKQEDPYI